MDRKQSRLMHLSEEQTKWVQLLPYPPILINIIMKNFKDKLEIVESILSIIVSIIAIWGSILAYNSEIVHKIKTVVEHHYEQIVDEDL